MAILVEYVKHLTELPAKKRQPFYLPSALVIEHFEMVYAANAIVEKREIPNPTKLVNWYHGAFCPNAPWLPGLAANPEYRETLDGCKLVIDGYFRRNGIPTPTDAMCFSCHPPGGAKPRDVQAADIKDFAEKLNKERESMKEYNNNNH